MGRTGKNSVASDARGSGVGCAAFFFALLAILSLAVLIVAFLPPVLQINKARSWTAVPCEILVSEVVASGGTRQVRIAYEYRIDGVTHTGDRYQFSDPWIGGRGDREKIIGALRPGTSATCYVDPADPTRAVIERGYTPDLWFGLIPAIFLFIGITGFLGMVMFRSHDRQAGIGYGLSEKSPSPMPMMKRATLFNRPGDQPLVVLEPSGASVRALVFLIIFAAIWNAIVGVMLWQMIGQWQRGRGDVCFSLFIIPFVIVGALMIAVTIHQLLAMFNPRLRLRIRSQELKLGQTTPVEWECIGRWDRISRLRLYLEGAEQTEYRRGTRQYTDHSVFARLDIADIHRDYEIREGKTTFTVPADTVPSFTGGSNRIVWKIRVHGEIHRWPDMKQEIDVTLIPVDIPPDNQS